MFGKKVCNLLGIRYPIIQGGMVWVSGAKLAAAVSNEGGLGVLGAGSMHPEMLRLHIQKCNQLTTYPFAVNVPLIYPQIAELMEVIVAEGVKIVITSAGNPHTWTSILKEKDITVLHVVSSIKFALKAQEAGVDAVIAEGFEAGGHNGREETTTFTLLPMVKAQIRVPLIAAGGIGTGAGILAAQVLGADGVQLGSRFAITQESSAHEQFKQAMLGLVDGDTQLTFKELAPVRIVKNNYYQKLLELYKTCPDKTTLQSFYDAAKLKTGIFEGNVTEGKLEIGQIVGMIREIPTVAILMNQLLTEYQNAKNQLLEND